MDLTSTQQKSIDKASELLYPYCKNEPVANHCFYYEVENDWNNDYYIEEITCEDENCVKTAKKQIKKQLKNDYNKNLKINPIYFNNDGDHDGFDLCCICGKHLNEYLSWVDGGELEHFESIKPIDNKEYIINSSFELHGLLYSTRWSVDKDYKGDLSKRIISLSNKITKLLTN